MAAKKVQKTFQLHMLAGKATPAPPVGPTLGQYGLNIGMVVKDFNDKTRELMSKYPGVDLKVPVNFKVYVDRSFDMEILPPLTSHLILWKAKLKAGSGEPNKSKIGKITMDDVKEIAQIKKEVMNTNKEESIMKSIIGTAKNMGIEVA